MTTQIIQSGSFKAVLTLLSRAISAIVGIVLVPVYVNIIGVESYGLVAFYGTLAGSLAILDLGLSTAISRQVAVLKAHADRKKETGDLIFSVEIIYWSISLLLGLLIILLARPIATYWVQAKDLQPAVIEKAVRLMGLIFAFQFPVSIYNGVMIGLEKQASNAILTISFTIIRAAGVILVLKLFSPTVEAYFIWQVILTLLFTFVLRYFALHKLSGGNRRQFSVIQLKSIWKFAAGMTGISAITFFLSQIDKIVVSKMVLLEFVGYYNLAFLVSGMIQQIISPIQIVIFPRFVSLITHNKQKDLLDLYHKSCKWISIIVFPVGFILIFFAKDILFLWTKNPALIENTTPLLQICAAGTICNCMMVIPYSYLLARGNTRFTIYQNIIASVFLVPMLFWWTGKYGVIGASYLWLSVNAGYVLIGLPVFYKTFLKGEIATWFKKDVLLPLFASALLIGGAKYLQMQMIPDITIIYFMLLLLFFMTLYALVIPELRAIGHKMIMRWKA